MTKPPLILALAVLLAACGQRAVEVRMVDRHYAFTGMTIRTGGWCPCSPESGKRVLFRSCDPDDLRSVLEKGGVIDALRPVYAKWCDLKDRGDSSGRSRHPVVQSLRCFG